MPHSYYLLNCCCPPDCDDLNPETDEPKGNENCQACVIWDWLATPRYMDD